MVRENSRSTSPAGRTSLAFLLPILAVVALVPLIVYMHYSVLPARQAAVWFTPYNVDFFSYYKAATLGALTGIACVFALHLQYTSRGHHFGRDAIFIPLAIFLLLVIVSTILSGDRQTAAFGFADRFEGMWVWLCYGVICYLTAGMLREERDTKAFLAALAAGFSVVGIIGLMQFAGQDPFENEAVKRLIMPRRYRDTLGIKISSSFDVYSTLSHNNFVGSYVSLTVPVLAVFLIRLGGWKRKLVLLPLLALGYVLFAGSQARSSMIGLAAAAIVVAVFLGFRKGKISLSRLLAYTLPALVLALALGFFALSGNQEIAAFRNSIKSGTISRALTLIQDITLVFSPGERRASGLDSVPFEYPEVTEDSIKVKILSEQLILGTGKDEIAPSDGDGQPLPFQNLGSRGYVILDERYAGFEYSWLRGGTSARKLLKVRHPPLGIEFFFIVENGRPAISDYAGRPLEFREVPHWGFEGLERIGSGRGYIWSRILPLVAARPLFGHGPDTLPIYFPQNDLKGKYHAYDRMWVLIDKPHDLYLAIAFNSGIPALLAVLVFLGIYISRALRLYWKAELRSFPEIAGFGIFAGIAGYLAAAVFNDSVVSVAPVFWAMLGAGIGINRIVEGRRGIRK